MWIKCGHTMLNMSKVKMLSMEPNSASGMRLEALVEGADLPVVLAVTPPPSDANYNEELATLKHYLKAVYKGLEEGWTTYEFGQPVSGMPLHEEVDLTADMDVIAKTIELARARHDSLKAGDKQKSSVEQDNLDKHINSLTHEQRDTILALCWYGRGDFENYESAVKHTTTIPSDSIAGYLSDKFPLDEYLVAGVERKMKTTWPILL